MLNWIEKRTGFISMTKDFLTEDVPGGASYWYVFGSATLFAMIVQIVTGIFLTFFYAPSAATAWESTRAIYLNPYTHFLLAVHYWGASAMIALVFLHLLQVLIFGAYKSPRELQWVVGVILLLVTLVLGLTGYLLPWDMDAYFASQVSLNIVGLAPIAGPFLQHVAQGGGSMGTATINRFFGLHVWLMPAVLVALVGAHLAIFRHNGAAGPVVDDARTTKLGRFWPDQFFMDGAFSFIIFIVICCLSIFSPPYLDAKADPTKFFVPYPAWYFLSLFGLLALVPPEIHLGPLAIGTELIATIIVPTLFLIVILLLPWLDRSTGRGLRSRSWLALDRSGHRLRDYRIDGLRPDHDDDQTGGRAGFAARIGGANGAGGHDAVARSGRTGRDSRRGSRGHESNAVHYKRCGRASLCRQLFDLSRRARPRCARLVPPARQQFDRYRRSKQSHRDRPQRPAPAD